MSTSYYRLKEPFTALRLIRGGGHDRLLLYEGGAYCGTLTLSKGNGEQVARIFASTEADNVCPLRTHWGGKEVGAVVTINDIEIQDEATVISEYGEILTVAEVKARAGAKRDDGMPTELFGYQKP